MKGPLKQNNNQIVDSDEKIVAKVADYEDGSQIVNAVNLDYRTKSMTVDMWRLINYFKANEQILEGNRPLEQSVKRIEKYLLKDVNYD